MTTTALQPEPISNRAAQLVMTFGRATLIVLFAMMFTAVLMPEVRSAIRGSILRDYRVVLSTAHGNLIGSGSDFTVAKVRTRDSIFLEVYRANSDGSQKLVERIELPDKKDGFFNFNGQATNLAIDDIDGDGQAEILVPSFDQNMVGHLSIYRFDSSSGSFRQSSL